MKQIKKIMVPLAFSPYSQSIIEYATNFAISLAAEQIIFVSVVNQRDVDAVTTISSLGYEVDGEHYVHEIKKTRVTELEKMLNTVEFPEEQMKLIISVGKPADKLLKIAVREDVDIIVMGVRARGEISSAFTGSVAEKMFKRSPVTIVSFRPEDIARKLKKRITEK